MKDTCFVVLLLCISSFFSVQADECIVGVIGERAILPCVYNGVKNLTLLHISSEWKRGMEIVHTAFWMEGKVEMQNVSHSNRTTVSSLAPKTGDFSVELHDIHLSDAHNYSFNLKLLGQNRSSLVCTVCLTIAGHFSRPTLLRANGVYGAETSLLCNSLGGFPSPSIYWLVNHTQRPPETSVTTYMTTLPQSELYNITTVLSINISVDTAVSCVIENKLLNETLKATNFVFLSRKSERRLSEHIWVFSAALCVVVSLLVATSLYFQKKWDRDQKRKQHRCGDDSCWEGTDMIVFDLKQWASSPETDV
ncbi:ICOS ligand-like isoform X2 [Carassius auratus]|uniref:ICOS ligand-like isoform X2 n=1 Tax=Carassius auratus TaxID=7957 RepID=A0A6P6NSQ8_CARAU|nr:ICOS ligand-like isoform X2 [Carassius auratus]